MSLYEQYTKKSGVFASKPTEEEAPIEPSKDGFLTRTFRGIARTLLPKSAEKKIGIDRETVAARKEQEVAQKTAERDARVAAQEAKKASLSEQYDSKSGVFSKETPTQLPEPRFDDIQMSMAQSLDTVKPEVREAGEKMFRMSMEEQLAQPQPLIPETRYRPNIPLPSQEQLENPRIAEKYKEALEANKVPGFVDTMKHAYEAYSEGALRTVENLAVGEFGAISSLLGAAQWAGAEKAKGPADAIDNWINTVVEERGDDNTFVDQLTQGIGSSAFFFVPGAGVMKGTQLLTTFSPRLAMLFGGTASSVLEASAEAGNTYRAKISLGDSEQEASEDALRVFALNAMLVTLTNRFGVFNPDQAGFVRRAIMSSPIEGVQEALQEIIQNRALGRDPFENAGTSFLIGAIIGPMMSSGVEVLSSGPNTQGVAITPRPKAEEAVDVQDDTQETAQPRRDTATEIKETPGDVVDANIEALPEFSGPAFRVETGFKQDPGTTAADVVRHEQSELGNKLGVSKEVIESLEGTPSSELVWVTRTEQDARRYGDEVGSVEVSPGARVLAEDGDGGVLILNTAAPVKQEQQEQTTPEKTEVPEAVTIKPEDIDAAVEQETARVLKEEHGGKEVFKDTARRKARESVIGSVEIQGRDTPRPDVKIGKRDLLDFVRAFPEENVEFTVATEKGRKVLTLKDDTMSAKLFPDALGLVSENLTDGQAVRLDKKELMKKGKAFRAYDASGEVLAFNPSKDLFKKPHSEKGQKEHDKLVKRSEIASNLADGLGVPVRTGRVAQRNALGIFKPYADTIRVKDRIGELRIPVIAHEAGHYIDYTMLAKERMPKGKNMHNWEPDKMVSELIPEKEIPALFQEYGDGDAKTFAKKKGKKTLRKEAFAEFVRMFVTDPTKAAERAPEFSAIWADLMDAHPEVKATLEQTQRDYALFQSMPSVAKVRSAISFEQKTASMKERWHNFTEGMHNMYSKWKSDLHPLARFADLAKKKAAERGVEIPIEEDPHIVARLSRGWVGKAATFLETGTFDKNDYYETKNGRAVPKFSGESFRDIMTPIEQKNVSEQFVVYLVSLRALELHDRGISPGIELDDARASLVEIEESENAALFRETQKKLMTYQNSVLAYARDSGLMSKETFDQMTELNQFYVPFFRVRDELEVQGFMGRGMGSIRNPVKRIKGSDLDIMNPLESIVKNTYTLIEAAERNQVNMAMVNTSKVHPEVAQLFEPIPEKQMKVAGVTPNKIIEQAFGGKTGMRMASMMNAGKIDPSTAQQLLGKFGEEVINIFKPSMMDQTNVTVVLVDGKRKHFQTDPEIYKALHAMEVEEVGFVWRILSYPARWLRAGATLTPEFVVRNPARDLMSAYVYSEHGFMPPIDVPRGLYGSVGKDQDFLLWRMSGGAQSMLVSMDRTSLRKEYVELVKNHATKIGKAKNAAKYIMNPVEGMRILSETTEKMTRIGDFKRSLDNSAHPMAAAYGSREVTLDFARMGSKGRSLNAIAAFFNANLEGSDRMFRSFRDRPYKTTVKALVGITLPSIVLATLNQDEEGWDEIPQWQKNLFWLFHVERPENVPEFLIHEPDDGILTKIVKPFSRTGSGAVWFRFPKPFELGIIWGSIPERIWESVVLDREDVDYKELRKAAMDGAMPGIIPTGFIPVLENTTNYSFFLGRKIVPESREDLPAFAQYTEYTSETAKTLGRWFNLSPAKIDNVIRGYFAGLGRYAVDATDDILRAVGIAPSKNEVPEPSKTLADVPVVRAFVVRNPVGGSSESVNRFYEKAEQARAAALYHDELIQEGKAEEAQQWAVEHPELFLAAHYQKMRTVISGVRNNIVLIRDSQTLSAEEKRARIDEMNALITDLAYKALNMTLKNQ